MINNNSLWFESYKINFDFSKTFHNFSKTFKDLEKTFTDFKDFQGPYEPCSELKKYLLGMIEVSM